VGTRAGLDAVEKRKIPSPLDKKKKTEDIFKNHETNLSDLKSSGIP
jgi:hypothetical protein